jgi:hypothetical protein
MQSSGAMLSRQVAVGGGALLGDEAPGLGYL